MFLGSFAVQAIARDAKAGCSGPVPFPAGLAGRAWRLRERLEEEEVAVRVSVREAARGERPGRGQPPATGLHPGGGATSRLD